MLHSLVQKTSEANVVWYQIEVPTTFPDYLSTGSPFFWSDGKICRRPLCFMVKFPGFGMFPLIFVNTNSLINREQFPSQHPSLFFFKVIPVNRGLPWMQAGLDQCCSLCHDVLGELNGVEWSWMELNGVDQFIWKHLKTKDFSRRQELWVWSIWQRLTAFDSVWLRLTLLRDYSIGECDPTWHNM